MASAIKQEVYFFICTAESEDDVITPFTGTIVRGGNETSPIILAPAPTKLPLPMRGASPRDESGLELIVT